MTRMLITVGSVVSLPDFENEKFVVANIRKGGMGTIFFLISTRPERLSFALKTYQRSSGYDAFVRECEIWMLASRHPHVAKIRWFGNFHGQPAVLADWYGSTLADVDLSKWSDPKLFSFVTELVMVLDDVHRTLALFHRDIKPDNILIENDGSPMVTDFGVACLAPHAQPLQSLDDQGFTLDSPVSFGQVAGTPKYMAPELLLDLASPSIATEVYAIGITLYEVLVGSHPYLPSIGASRPNWSAPDPSLLKSVLDPRGTIGEKLLALVVSCIELDPLRRPTSYHSLLAILGQDGHQSHHETKDQVSGILLRAQLMRKTGRLEKARSTLVSLQERTPDDPRVTNALGVLMAEAGDSRAAIHWFKASFLSLQATSGMSGSEAFPAPALNLAGLLINEGCFGEAEDCIRLAREWTIGHEEIRTWYLEFSWLLLRECRYEEAYHHLVTMSQSKSLSDTGIAMLTLALWGVGEPTRRLNTIAGLFQGRSLCSKELYVAASLLSCIAGSNYLLDELSSELKIVNSRECAGATPSPNATYCHGNTKSQDDWARMLAHMLLGTSAGANK